MTNPATIFPITDAEAGELHAMGWESGYGWASEFDWYWRPSSGPCIWLEDAPDIMQRFLSDLDGIRRTAQAKIERERMNDAAPDLLAAARKALDFIQSPPYEPSIARSTKAQDALVDVLAKVECR